MLRLLLLAVLATAPLLADEGASIGLGVGQQKVIQIPNLSRVAIGEPEIADVKQIGGGGELLITGVGEGRTSLLIWRTNDSRLSYLVVVRRQDPKDLMSEVRALLGEREGIHVRVVGDRVVIEGETLTGDDYERVQQLTQLYPQVTSFVRPSGNARRAAAEALNRALQRHGLRGVSAGVLGNTLVLEGSVESKDDLRKLDLIARSAAEKAENLVTVGAKKIILVEVDFVVGIKPPAALVSTGEGATASVSIIHPIAGLDSGQTQRSASVSVSASAATDFSAGARFDNGAVRVLSQPRLVCASGEKAQFVAGGEIPIVMVTQSQSSVEFKKFGILLDITPTADRNGNIAAEIHAEVSDVDRSIAVRANGFDLPGLRVRDVKTSVTVKDGETIVLSGLFNYSEDKEVSKVPLLGHIPILGELFKSRSFVERKTELAIYVTPRMISPGTEKANELIDGARKLYKDAEDSVSFSVFD